MHVVQWTIYALVGSEKGGQNMCATVTDAAGFTIK